MLIFSYVITEKKSGLVSDLLRNLNNQIEISGETQMEADFFLIYFRTIPTVLKGSAACDELLIRFNGLTFRNPFWENC